MEHIKLYINKKNTFRNPNIDCLRIFSMFSIVIDHIIFHGKARIKFKSKMLILLLILCMWHVSCFGIISGLIENKIPKFSNLLYLWIITVFYSILFNIIYNIIKNITFNKNNFISNIFPIVNNKYWYLTAYFGIFPFLTLINNGVLSLNQTNIKKILYFILSICIIWTYYFGDCFKQHNGKSPYSFLIFYLLGSYIKKYIFFKNHHLIYRIAIFIICFISFVYISMITYIIYIKNYSKTLASIFRIEINSFPMILQALTITIMIATINFNKYLERFITFIGPLTFDVYLIHDNTYVRNAYIAKSFNDYPININISFLFFLIIFKAISIFFICIFFAYIRNRIFKILKIKNLCIKLDIITTKITYYLI